LARVNGFARCAAAALAAAAIAACAARPPPPAPPPPPPPPDAHESDASFDWQALLIAPMGSTLKSVPVALHEALLFHDEAGDSRVPDDGECYSPDSAPPRFLGRTPDEYLLCFRQDHLLRIRASVQLGEDAESLFHEACARWLRKADLGPGGPAGSETAAPEAAACQGRSGLVRFHARLAPDIEGSAAGPGGDAGPGSAAPAGAEDAKATTVRVVLDGFPDLRE
jgi:hypothetical protein